MSLIDLFVKREEPIEQNSSTKTEDTSASPQDLLLKSLLKGEKITKEKALSIPAIAGAVDKISNSVAMLPVKLYQYTIDKETGEKKSQEIKEDIRLRLLNQDTGDLLDPFQLKKAIVHDYLVDKGAYVFIEKDKNEFKSLRYVEPDYVSPLTNYDPIYKDAKYSVYGKEYELYEFLTILRNTKDGVKGISVVDEISKSIETAFTTILFELGLVKKGGAKKGFLTATKKLGKEEIQKLKEAWNKYYGNNNEENVIVLNDGLDFKEGSSSSVELQVNERKKTLNDDIKDVFHIYPDFNNTIKDAVMPIISAIESALNKNFLLESEKATYYFSFDTKPLLRGTPKERFEAYKIANETGWITKNEIRKEEDYDPIKGLDIIAMNLANVVYDVKTGKYYTPNTGEVTNINNQEPSQGGEEDEDTSKK